MNIIKKSSLPGNDSVINYANDEEETRINSRESYAADKIFKRQQAVALLELGVSGDYEGREMKLL